MSVHLLKPALRAQDIYHLQQRQKNRLADFKGEKVYPVWTSRKPARVDELLDGGSLYWIVKNFIQCRQEILGFETIEEEDVKPSYLFMCRAQLIRTQAIEKRAFQGWRYLEPTSAPPDAGPVHENDDRPPPELEGALRNAGLL